LYLFYSGLVHCPLRQILMELGAQVDARTLDGWTALHSACNWGQADCAAVLLRHGADINSQTGGLQTPLHLAAANAKNIEIFRLLLSNEFLDGSRRNRVGETARDVAQRSCRFHKIFDAIDESINVL